MSRIVPRGGVALCALAVALLCLPTFAEARPPGAAKSKLSAAAKRCSAAAKRKSKRQRRAKRRCRARLAATKRDRTKPVVGFKAPAAGATVSGTLSGAACEATATDKGGVNRVEFSVDGIALNAQRTAPYNCVWDTTGVSPGQHTLIARAVDAAGNAGSASVTVSVPAAAPTSAPAPAPEPTATPTPSPEPTPMEPPAIAGQGYVKVFEDNFDTLNAALGATETDSARWNNLWYRPAIPPGAVTVSNSVLSINSRRSDGYPDLALSTRRATKAGSYAFTYGYMEARIRWTGGQGHWPAFWTLNLQHAFDGASACPTLNAEIDVLEGQGSEPRRHYTALHRNTSSRCSVADEWKPRPNYFDAATSLAGTWHDYAVLWTPTEVKWYLDGQLVNQTATYDSTNQRSFLILQSDSGGWMGGPDASTPDNLVTEFDWVRVWQKPMPLSEPANALLW